MSPIDIVQFIKPLEEKIKKLQEDNAKLLAYIDQNVGCSIVCSDCNCGKKEMLKND